MSVTVRPALPRDRQAILTLVERAFTAPDHDGREEVQIVLDTWRLDATIPGLELVGVDGEVLLGHVLGARGALGSPPVAAVAPLCVDPGRQGRGVGTALMNELLRRAEQQGWPAVVLLGDPGYYGRFGFEPAGARGVVYEVVGEDDPAFQMRALPTLDADTRGIFRYCWEA
jgi:putative acetyltransferase